jgi:histidinol-phosphatase (PHP family)
MVIDSHVHTVLSGHASGRAIDYAIAGAALGVDVITFTEHMPIPDGWDPDSEYTLPLHAVPTYLSDVAEAQTVEGIDVLCGAEVDWLPEHEEIMARNIALADFDVVLGSVHFVGDWAFDDPRLTSRYEHEDVDLLWRRYFEQLTDAARSGLFDVMAHPDLVKKFGFRPSFDPRGLYDDAATAFADAGVSIEVSSAGLRKPCAEIYPAPEFLKACHRAGVPVTCSSDAHRPQDVAWGFDHVTDALRAAGYESFVYFIGRQPQEVSLRP